MSATNIFLHTCLSALRTIIHVSLTDFSNYKCHFHVIHIYSSLISKAKATVSYKLNTLQSSLLAFFCFTLFFCLMGFALVTPSPPRSLAYFEAVAFLLLKAPIF